MNTERNRFIVRKHAGIVAGERLRTRNRERSFAARHVGRKHSVEVLEQVLVHGELAVHPRARGARDARGTG
jgi:hypothetical protein